MTTTTCKSCGALITWVRTKAGKRMPLDPVPAEDGNVVIDESGIAHVLGKGEEWHGDRYRSHFSSCVHAAFHRRKQS